MRTGTNMLKQRGRPKKYDAVEAIKAAGSVFWLKGYSGTSLDDLSVAMGMNRPSIYRAFGDKEAIYRQALAQFGEQMDQSFQEEILEEEDISLGFRNFYRAALDLYSSNDMAGGCMLWCTAPSAAIIHPEVQADLLSVINHLDGLIYAKIKKAIKQDQLNREVDARTLSKLLQALLHSLAIRVRSGEPKKALQKLADKSVLMLLSIQ